MAQDASRLEMTNRLSWPGRAIITVAWCSVRCLLRMRLRCVGTSLWHWGEYSAVLFALTFALMAFCMRLRESRRRPRPRTDWLKPVPPFPLAASDLTIRPACRTRQALYRRWAMWRLYGRAERQL